MGPPRGVSVHVCVLAGGARDAGSMQPAVVGGWNELVCLVCLVYLVLSARVYMHSVKRGGNQPPNNRGMDTFERPTKRTPSTYIYILHRSGVVSILDVLGVLMVSVGLTHEMDAVFNAPADDLPRLLCV